MKKLLVFGLVAFLAGVCPSVRAGLLFSDGFNYPDGLVETDGFWYVYYPSSPHLDAFVTNNLLILDQDNYDAVAAPSNNFTAPDPLYASFTINVSTLPTTTGGYFCEFKDNTNDYVCRIFINRTGAVVPGTYRLGIANYASSITTAGATNYPLDLATDITYQVVFDFSVSGVLGELAINPASESDLHTSPAYGNDTTTNVALQNIQISQIAFSQYNGQGVAAIGNVLVGTSYGDVVTNAPWKPIIGIQPQGTNIYAGHDVTLYTAASGTGALTYEWLLNGSPFGGSTSNILTLTDLQNTGNYSVVISDVAGSVTSQVASITVDTTPTRPFFTKQPTGVTNALGATIVLSAVADGTGPITYQWFFEPTNTGAVFFALSGQTNAALTMTGVNFTNTGSYYVTAMNSVSSSNSAVVSVQITPPPTVTLGYLHSLLLSNPPTPFYNINNGQIYNVQGVVISFAGLSGTYSEYFIQDGTGGALVFINGAGSTNVQPAGTLVSVTGAAQQYYGALEMVPNVATGSNSVTVISTNNPLPASIPLDLAQMATNPMTPYGLQVQDSLVTVTNVYIYATSTGGAVSGNFPSGASKTLYLFNQPYAPGSPYLLLYIFASDTNLVGQPIPSYAYEITGAMGIYNPTEAELYPTRYQDFVTTLPPSFRASATVSNGVPRLSWPTVSGSTYSVYSATSLLGPWTQHFGLGYYPSVGAYTETNSAAAKFYRISSP